MSVERLTWRMVRFTVRGDGPAYVDLGEVAAVVDAPFPGAGELDVSRGGYIIMRSGTRIHVCETAETIFEEVHRYNMEQEPPKKPMKLSASAPGIDLGVPCQHIGCIDGATVATPHGPRCEAHAARAS